MRRVAKAKPARASQARPAKSAKRPGAGKRPAAAKGHATPPIIGAVSAATGPARIELSAECTLRDAPALKARLLDTVSSTDCVIVNARAVERIDASALQLLVAFARREQAAGRRVQWEQPSEALLASGARLGLREALGLPAPRGESA